MPHSYLKVVGNPEYRCNNSSPRYMRENHYAILVFRLKISYVFKYKISITLTKNSNMSWKEHTQSSDKNIEKQLK